MNIAFLSHQAANLYLFRLPIMLQMQTLGHSVFAVCPEGEYFNRFDEHGIKAVSYVINRGSLNPLKELGAIRNIYRALKRLDVDVLHTFTAKPNIYGAIAGHIAKVPVIVSTVTGLGSYYIERSKKARAIRTLIETLYTLAFKRSNGVIFQNGDDRRYFVEHAIVKADKAIVIKSSGVDTQAYSKEAVDLQTQEQLKHSLGIGDEVVVLMVARAIWHKGIKEYIDAAGMVRKRFENVVFLLVGGIDSGNFSAVPEAYLTQQREVRWLGERKDIIALLAISDIKVLPSYREGVPRTLLEACAMGLPVVTTDTVGCKEVVQEGVNGYLVPVGDAGALADKIVLLVEDAPKRVQFGKASLELACNEFSVGKVVEQYLAFYDKVTSV